MLSARTSGLVLALSLGLGALPASAVAPCFDLCHLNQGQPLLLVDKGELWIRRCTRARSGTPPAKCVLERVGLDGRVLAQVLQEASHDERRFKQRHLRGHKVARLGHQSAWRDLTKPYLHRPIVGKSLRLRFVKNTLVCTSSRTKIRRPLGCRPSSVVVMATGIGRDGKPEEQRGVVAIIATCKQKRGTREVVAICQSSL
jgi:hypothetical protein